MGGPKSNEKYIQRYPLGVDMHKQGLDVHVAGGHINNHWSKRIRTEISDTIELELCESRLGGEFTWIVYDYYSPTQAKTRESKKCPAKYKDIGAKLVDAFDEIFYDGQPLN